MVAFACMICGVKICCSLRMLGRVNLFHRYVLSQVRVCVSPYFDAFLFPLVGGKIGNLFLQVTKSYRTLMFWSNLLPVVIIVFDAAGNEEIIYVSVENEIKCFDLHVVCLFKWS